MWNGLPKVTDQPQQGKVAGRKLDSQVASFPVLCCLCKASILRFQKLKDTKGLQWKINLLSITVSNHLSLFPFCQLRNNRNLKCEVGTQHPGLLQAHEMFFLCACFSLGIFVFICAYFFFSPGKLRVSKRIKSTFWSWLEVRGCIKCGLICEMLTVLWSPVWSFRHSFCLESWDKSLSFLLFDVALWGFCCQNLKCHALY